MLKFITGSVHSSSEKVFCNMISDACEKGDNVLVIIPDQYSFEYDKRLYNFLGAKKFNRIETAGFNRLAELVNKEYAGTSNKNATENAKMIQMYKAVRRFKKMGEVKFYNRAIEKGSFIARLINLTAEFIQSGISPEDLEAAAGRLEGSISRKLYDLSKLYKLYLEELSSAGLRDSLTLLADSKKLAEKNRYFEGMSIFIDAFSSFSSDEYRFIECMLMQADNVNVSLIFDKSDKYPSPFAQTIRVMDKIKRMASDCNVKYEHIKCGELEYTSNSLKRLNQVLSGKNYQDKVSADGITIMSANDIYEETEYICSEILRLVREENYKFGEIAVCARNLSEISSVMEGVFERYDIPYFIDTASKAEQSAIVIYLKSIFESVIPGEYHTDMILRYIKSPLCTIFDYDISEIEDYCIKWNVQGKMWLEEFTTHDSKNSASGRLEEIRKKIIEPLERFKKSCIDTTAGEICKALYVLLDEIDISRQVYSSVKRASMSSNETDLELARASKKLWQNVLGAVQSIYENMADEKISLRNFYELFKVMVLEMTISSPPQKADSVRCANAESSRLDDVKVMFVCEVNEGIFPSEVKSIGLLSEQDKQMLIKTGIEFNSTVMSSIENERMTVYRVFSMPTDKLYVLYSETDTKGGLKNPSLLVSKIANSFENAETKRISDMPLGFFCTSYRTGYYKYLERSKEIKVIKKNDSECSKEIKLANEVASLKNALLSNESYNLRIESLSKYIDDTSYTISSRTAKEIFYPVNFDLSATRIDKYYSCPFSYFCKYGLKLYKPDKIGLNNMYKGNFLHRCLEEIMTVEENGKRVYNEKFIYLTEEQLSEKIHISFLKYMSEEIGGDYGKTSSFYAGLDEYEKTVLKNVLIIQKEFEGSEFKPEFFEYKLEKANGESILKLKINDELTVNIWGSIDRADIFVNENGKKFLRIVDYKTGMTNLDISKVYHGLNLQMFIYLLALTSDMDLEPSSVMYSHIKEFTNFSDPEKDRDEHNIFSDRLKTYKPDGMMINDSSALMALNRTEEGNFTTLTFNKDMVSVSKKGKQPVSIEYLKAAEEFARRKIINLVTRLSDGKVPASPVMTKKGNVISSPCTYCDYYGVCSKTIHDEKDEYILSEDKIRFDEEINSIIEEENGGEKSE